MMISSKKNIAVHFFVLLYLIGFLILNCPDALNFLFNKDQGFQLALGQQILYGYHPVVDMTTGVYGPLVFYASALAQWISGGRLIGEVLVNLTGYVFAYFLIFCLAHRILKRKYLALLVVVLLPLLMPRFYKYYIVLGPSIFLMALYCFLLLDKKYSICFLAFASVFVGLYRFDFGFYAVLISFLAIFLKYKASLRFIKNMGTFFLYSILAVSPLLLFYFLRGSLIDALGELISYTSSLASGLDLPAPRPDLADSLLSSRNLFALQFWFFLLVPALGAIILAFRKEHVDSAQKRFLVCLFPFAALIFFQALHRSDYAHFLQVLPLSFLIFFWIVDQLLDWAAQPLGFPGKATVIVGLVFCFSVLASFFPFLNTENPQPLTAKVSGVENKFAEYALSREELIDAYRLKLFYSPRRWVIETIDQVRSLTGLSDDVLILPYQAQLYYFVERPIGARFGLIFPGIFAREGAQTDFIESLRDTRVVVDLPGQSFDGMPERNARHYAPEVMQYIYRNYRLFKRIGPANILVRN